MKTWNSILSLILLPACAEIDAGDEPLPEDPPLELRTGPSSVEAACWAVGVMDPACDDPSVCPGEWECPDVPSDGWTLRGNNAMFLAGTGAIGRLGLAADDLPDHLRRFCLYEASTPTVPVSLPQGVVASLDCPAVAPLGNVLSEGLQPYMQAAFEAHAGGSPSNIVLGNNAVKVGIVDTHSSQWVGVDPVSKHAPTMAAIVNKLACKGSPNCSVDIYHAMGLPLDETGAVAEPGGSYGTRSHLAIGIVEAVEAWKATNTLEPLVINLSVGWTATPGLCKKSEENPWCTDHPLAFHQLMADPVASPDLDTLFAVEAVHAALMYASCHGAIIVAAAGNAYDDSCNEEQVAPAVWAQYHAPTKNECGLLGFLPPGSLEDRLPVNTTDSWPLVTPVAGVRHNNLPLGVTRPGSKTVLMAAGYHATVDPNEAPLSGTSVSAATVSAAAALMWSQDSTLSPWRLTDEMYWDGRPSGWFPEMDQFRDSVYDKTRILMMCRAQPAGSTCSQTQYLTRLGTAVTALNNEAEAQANALGLTAIPLEGSPLAEDVCDVCGEEATVFADPAPVSTEHWFFNECEELPATFVFDTNAELAGPQPPAHVCPDCPIIFNPPTTQTSATISVNDVWQSHPYPWTGANLEFTHSDGRVTFIDLSRLVGLTTLKTTDAVRLDLGRDLINVRSARMTVTMLDARGEPFDASNEVLYSVK